LSSLFLLASGAALAQNDVATKADEYLNIYAKRGSFSGAVLIAKGGKVLLRKGYGNANYELNVKNAPETVFRIGSITCTKQSPRT